MSMKSFFACLALCALLVPAAVGAQVKIVDSKIGVYVKYGDANIRIDKIVIPTVTQSWAVRG